MEHKRWYALVVVLAFVVLAAMACDDGYTTTARTPSAFELQREAELMAVEETAIAQETRESMAAQARGTADALDNDARGTRQVRDAQATESALHVQQTREAWELHQTRQAADVYATRTATAEFATATKDTINETATATAAVATSVALKRKANVEGTRAAADSAAIVATQSAIERQTRIEETTQTVKAWGGLLALAGGIIGLGWLGWKLATLVDDRGRVVRRKADEGEPLILISREQVAAPLRMFGPVIDAKRGEERAPLLAPSAAHQADTTKRQQASNAIQAAQAGRIAEAKQTKERKTIVVQPGENRARLRRIQKPREEPGLIGAIGRESVPPKLLEHIEGEWEVVDD